MTTWRITFNANGQAVAQWVKAGGTVTLYSLHTDHLGSVVAMSNKAGGFISGSIARYDPFGNFRATPTTNPGISPTPT